LQIEGPLGQGQFGDVLKITWAKLGSGDARETFALKSIDRSQFRGPHHQHMVMTERNVMEGLSHPFHIKLINT
jgi:hypothetical protein